jgi:membrane protein
MRRWRRSEDPGHEDPLSLSPAEARRHIPAPGAPDPRGRRAPAPWRLPPRGWRDVLVRVRHEVADDNLSLIAAGVGFYFLLSVFPGLIATVSIWGLFTDPLAIEGQIRGLLDILPRDAALLLGEQLHEIARGGGAGLGLSALVSIGVALWSASQGSRALIAGVNIAYDETEKRSGVRLRGLALSFTLGAVVFLAVSLTLIAALPAVLARLPLAPVARLLTVGFSWAVLLAMLLGALAATYRYGPSRRQARWRWVSVGSLVAAALWLLASGAFSWYASRFGTYNETYGTLAGAVLLLLWLQITAYVVLLGAELNAEAEHQTALDTTAGRPRPMGRRRAVVADTLGRSAEQARVARRQAGGTPHRAADDP